MHDLLLYLLVAWCTFPVGFFFCCPWCAPVCGTVLSDTFDRADSTNIGSNWTETAGDWSIASNKLRITTANAFALCNLAGTAGKQSISVIIRGSAVGDKVRVIANYTDANNYDFAEVTMAASSASVLRIFTRVGGTNTQIAQDHSTGATNNTDITVTICAHGHLFKVLAGSANASSYTANTGTKVGLATGGAVTGNVDFNTFVFNNFDNDTGGCPTCTLNCTACLGNLSASDYEVIIAGMGNGTCGTCNSLNATYILSPGTGCTYNVSGTICAFTVADAPGLNMEFVSGTTYRLRVGIAEVVGFSSFVHTWSKNYTGKIDETGSGHGACLFTSLAVPLTTAVNQHCKSQPGGVDATCTVTAF